LSAGETLLLAKSTHRPAEKRKASGANEIRVVGAGRAFCIPPLDSLSSLAQPAAHLHKNFPFVLIAVHLRFMLMKHQHPTSRPLGD